MLAVPVDPYLTDGIRWLRPGQPEARKTAACHPGLRDKSGGGQRSDLNAARISVANSSGSSQAAK
jgi:hypothetical protein